MVDKVRVKKYLRRSISRKTETFCRNPDENNTEGLQNLKYMLQKGDYMCKLGLKDEYFSVPLAKNSSQFIRFRWSGNL